MKNKVLVLAVCALNVLNLQAGDRAIAAIAGTLEPENGFKSFVQNIGESSDRSVEVKALNAKEAQKYNRIGHVRVVEVDATNGTGEAYRLQAVDPDAQIYVRMYRDQHYAYWWPANIVAGIWTVGSVYGTVAAREAKAKMNCLKSAVVGAATWYGMNKIWDYTDQSKDLQTEIVVPAATKTLETVSSQTALSAALGAWTAYLFGEGWFSGWMGSGRTSTTIKREKSGEATMRVAISTPIVGVSGVEYESVRAGGTYSIQWQREDERA